MRQYEFQLTRRDDGRKDRVYCTAPSERIAFVAVTHAYAPQFHISEYAIDSRDPHTILTEIDATECID